MKTKNIIWAFAVFASLASCSASDSVESNPNFPADGIIRVKTNVNDPVSRDANSDTENLSKFNLYVDCPDDPDYCYYALMKKDEFKHWDSYSSANDGVTPLMMKWKDNATKIKVTALGINNKNVSPFTFTRPTEYYVRTDQTSIDSVKASDILYINKKEIDPSKTENMDETGALKLEFAHRLSKLIITLTLASDFKPDVSSIKDITNFMVNGLKTIFLWNPSTNENISFDVGRVNPNYTIPFNSMFSKNPVGGATATYECIVVPQSLPANVFCISFTINGKRFFGQYHAQTPLTLTEGNSYSIPLFAFATTELVTIGTITPIPWDTKTDDEYYILK